MGAPRSAFKKTDILKGGHRTHGLRGRKRLGPSPSKKAGFYRVVRTSPASNLVSKLKKCQQTEKGSTMKKCILIVGLALALVGCKQQGGTSDQYGTERGTSS